MFYSIHVNGNKREVTYFLKILSLLSASPQPPKSFRDLFSAFLLSAIFLDAFLSYKVDGF